MLGYKQACPNPAWLLTKTVTCRFLQPWVLMACFHCYLSTYLLSAQRNNQ